MFEIKKIAETANVQVQGTNVHLQKNTISKDVSFSTNLTINGVLKGDGTIEIYEGKDILPELHIEIQSAAKQFQGEE